MRSFLPNDIKDKNRKIILDIILQNPELAKIEITQKTTMSFVTVSKIVDFFEEIGILMVSGQSRDGSGGLGRKRVVYTFNSNRYVTIGIQVIGNELFAVLVNLNSEVIASYVVKPQVPFYEDEFKVVFEETVEYLKNEADKYNAEVIGVGLGVDAAIDISKKTLRMRTNHTSEHDYPYEEILEKLTCMIDLPIILENDVNASTFAEFNYLDVGGTGPNDLLHIALGEGIGAGLIIDKKLHRGHNAGVGELEYMCFDTDYINTSSSVGWLESKLGLCYLAEKYNYDTENINLMTENEKAESIDYISKHIALVITNIVSLLDIHSVIISGKTILALPNEILKRTNHYVAQYTSYDLEISVSEKKDSTAIGAAVLALQNEMIKVIAG